MKNQSSDTPNQIDWEKINSLMAEQNRWVHLIVTIDEIATENQTLVKELALYDRDSTVAILSSLLTLPILQSHCIRLEILTVLALSYCKGQKEAKKDQIVDWFQLMGSSKCSMAEDPAEDVFVSLVQDDNGDYRIIEGLWEAAGFYTQCLLDVIRTMPDKNFFVKIKESIKSLLKISDLICEKAQLSRYQLGSDDKHSELSKSMLDDHNNLRSHVIITSEELNQRGIDPSFIVPFLLQNEMINSLPSQQIGLCSLDRYPLLLNEKNELMVLRPSALSIALRGFLIEMILDNGLEKAFNSSLAKIYETLISEIPLLGSKYRAPLFWKKSKNHRWSNFVLQVDSGYFISFHFFLPSIKTHPVNGFSRPFEDDGEITQLLQNSIDDVHEQFEKKDSFRKGIFVIIGCGWGKGYETQNIVMNYPGWRFESISAADLVRLSWLSEMSPDNFWRIHDGLKAVNDAGVRIANPNGILNLIGWVRSNSGHFIPNTMAFGEKITPESPIMINPPLNLIRSVRAEADQGYDRHSIQDNMDIWHKVQRALPNPYFKNESGTRCYVSLNDLNKKQLTAVYEGKLRLWVTTTAPNIKDRYVQFKLWELTYEWMHRIGIVLDQLSNIKPDQNSLKVHIQFKDSEPEEVPERKPNSDELLKLCQIQQNVESNSCVLSFEAGFIFGFNLSQNTAEKIIVRKLTQAYLELLEVQDYEYTAESVEKMVVLNKEARNFHIFQAQTFIDFVRDSIPQALVSINELDDAAAKIGLGWRILGKSKSNKVKGIKNCTKFLQKVVDHLLNEIFESLRSFERLSILKRLVANIERAYIKSEHWEKTSAAVLGLHGNNQSTINSYIKQISKYSGAKISSRVLIEITLCTSPLGTGINISDIELSKLIARVALLIRIGGLSDAIYYSALSPELKISPLGDILFCDDFGQMVVEPMLTHMLGDNYLNLAPLQKKNYEKHEAVGDTKSKFEDEFWQIWEAEMGFNIDEARKILDAIDDRGIQKNTAILTIKQSEFYKILNDENIESRIAESFLDRFSLKTRPTWDTPPKGFVPKDIYPWRFGRRLSYIARPILKVDNNDDPLMIISPYSLRKSFIFLLDGAYRGRLDQNFFNTEEMKNTWWGKASEGHTFTSKVAKKLSDNGWSVRENINLPEFLNCKIEFDYGDVDVLGWRADRKDVLIIECKDLSIARNYSEISALLSSYQGVEKNGSPDKLKRHLNRINFIEKNIEKLQRFTGVEKPQIRSCLICKGIVPMQYAKIEALDNTFVGNLENLAKKYS